MQQPTGVFQMRTVCNEKPLSPASCENSILLRHTLLLPKIVHSNSSRSSVGHSITMLAPVTDQYRYKSGNKALDSPVYRQKKQRRHHWNAIAFDTRLSSSSVNPKLFSIRWIFSYSSVGQLWIDAYSKAWIICVTFKLLITVNYHEFAS